MDDETRAHFAAMDARLEAMEARIMGRMNDNQERVLERLGGVDASIAALTEIARGTNTLLSVMASSLNDLAGRVTRLESKP